MKLTSFDAGMHASASESRWRRELDLRQALRQIQTAFDPHLLGNHLEERVDLGNADSAKHRFALLARDRYVSHSV